MKQIRPRHLLSIAAALVAVCAGWFAGATLTSPWLWLGAGASGAIVAWVARAAAADRPTGATPATQVDRLEARIAELEQSDAFWRHLSRASNDFLWESDAEHRFTRFLGSDGRPMDWVQKGIGMTRWELAGTGPDDPDWQDHLKVISAHEEFRDFRYAAYVDGVREVRSTSGVPVFDMDGMFAGYRGCASVVNEAPAAELRAQQSDRRLRMAVEALDGGVALFDHHDRLVFCNSRYRDAYEGSSGVRAEGTKFSDLLRGSLKHGYILDALGREEEWFERRMALHRQHHEPIEQALSNGTWQIVQERHLPHVGTLVVATDITPMKRAMQSLELYRNAVAASADLVCVINREHQYELVNAAYANAVGRPVEDLIGRTVEEVLSPEWYETDVRPYLARSFDGDMAGIEHWVDFAGSGRRYIETRYTPMRVDDEIVAAVSVIRDRTDREQAAATLRRAVEGTGRATGNELFPLLARNSAEAWSARVAAIYSISPDDAGVFLLAGSYTTDALALPERIAATDAIFQVVGEQGELFVAQAFAETFSEAHVFSAASFESFYGVRVGDVNDQTLGFIVVGADAAFERSNALRALMQIFAARSAAEIRRMLADAGRRLAEAGLRQSQKMEAIGQLTGGIAHDFNNVLASIIGFAQLAEFRNRQLKDDALERYVSEISRAGERASAMVRQLLAFSRTEPGSPEIIDLAHNVREELDMLAPTLPSSIRIAVHAPELTSMRADRTQMGQVLMNLCINARDAMQGRGELHISVESVQLDGHTCTSCGMTYSGEYVQLRVRDTGGGIDPSVLARMFDPFFTTKGPAEGTGMGLSVVHGIVHDHDGHISVQSELGVGTQFSINLPVVDEQGEIVEAVAERPLLAASGPTPRRLLLVDDDEPVARFIAELLAMRNVDCQVHYDPGAALDAFAAEPDAFAAVFTDYTMPGMNGLEMLTALRAVRPDLPAILCTGFGDQIAPAALDEHGVSHFLLKPMNPEQVVAAVLDVLESRDAAE
ncbi:MAG: ATP-binding protein [Pseudomonadota bacterium]